MPPVHFSIFIVQRGTIMQFGAVGMPVGVPIAGVAIPGIPMPGMPIPVRSIIMLDIILLLFASLVPYASSPTTGPFHGRIIFREVNSCNKGIEKSPLNTSEYRSLHWWLAGQYLWCRATAMPSATSGSLGRRLGFSTLPPPRFSPFLAAKSPVRELNISTWKLSPTFGLKPLIKLTFRVPFSAADPATMSLIEGAGTAEFDIEHAADGLGIVAHHAQAPAVPTPPG